MSESATPSDESRIENWLDILEAALAKGEPLIPEELCTDPVLLPRLKERYDKIVQVNGVLKDGSGEESPGAFPSTADAGRFSESQRIGPYKLLQQIGMGGMGTVWMAEQSKPIRRRVAIKLITSPDPRKQIIARFEAERQAIALMNHPNIAGILDAGETDNGVPYFVMELVEGVPITDYCDKKELGVRERLELFLQVCEAVQHAHSKGIIHRDIKPTNVLVAQYDQKPVAKVIDFGIAKAVNADLTDKTYFTEFGQVVGTFRYMSPEQAEMNSLGLDTRTDIFSLGVLLHELLTGETPITEQQFEEAAMLQRLNLVKNQESSKASERVSTSSNDQLISKRGMNRQQLASVLRGDVDAILLVATANERDRRYKTAEAFGSDIQRFLSGDLVTARPPSTAYRLKKFVTKHKGTVSAVTTIILLLVLAVAGTGLGLAEANKSLSLAEAATNSANDNAEKASIEAKKAERARDRAEKSAALAKFRLANANWEANRVSDARESLQEIPEAYRDFEWNYCNRVFSGSRLTLYGHESGVNSAAFTANGDRIISGGDDGTVRIWNATTGKLLSTWKFHTAKVNSVAISPDDSMVASGSQDGTVRIWDPNERSKPKTLTLGLNVKQVSFSHDGSQLICACDTTEDNVFSNQQKSGVYLFDVQTEDAINVENNRQKRRFDAVGGTDAIGNLDGKSIAISGNVLWDAATGEKLTVFERPDFYYSAAFSPDGTAVAFAYSRVTIRSPQTGKILSSLQTGKALSVAFSPDGRRLASGSSDGTVRLWDVESGRQIAVLKGHTAAVKDVSFNFTGTRLVSASYDGMIKVWDMTGSQRSTVHGRDTFNAIAHSPNGNLLASGGEDTKVRLWDPSSGEELKVLRGHESRVNDVAFDGSGQLLASGSDDGKIRIWDTNSHEMVQILEGHNGDVERVAFSRDGTKLFAYGTRESYISKHVTVFDVDSGAAENRIDVNRKGNEGFCISTGTDRFAVHRDDGSVDIVDGISGEVQISIPKHHSVSRIALAFSADGKRLVSAGRRIAVWDIESEKELFSVKGYPIKGTQSAAFNQNGTRIVTCSMQGEVDVWDIQSGDKIFTFVDKVDSPKRVCFHPRGTSIVACGIGLRIWDASPQAGTRLLLGHSAEVTGTILSSDGLRLASRSWDNTVRVWSTITGEEVLVLRGLAWGADHLAFVSEDRFLAAAVGHNELLVWNVQNGERVLALQDYGSGMPIFNADGSLVVARYASDSMRIWSVPSGKLVYTLVGHRDVNGFQFSEDGRHVISYSSDETMIWDVSTGDRIKGKEIPTTDDGIDSPSPRWLAIPDGENILLVDLDYMQTHRTAEPAQRESVIRWHEEQRWDAVNDDAWFAAAFHAGQLVSHSSTEENRENLTTAYEKLSRDKRMFLPSFVKQAVKDSQEDAEKE